MDGVYMLPLREERSREGLVFWLKISWLAAWNAFSTSLLVYVSSSFTSLPRERTAQTLHRHVPS